ncbi:MAG: hypothetical protein IJK96_05580 [Bacteroidales bacterium]|nr:hypothetical protein [Bacteroidales bacterium]
MKYLLITLLPLFLSGLLTDSQNAVQYNNYTNYTDAAIKIQNIWPEGYENRISFDVNSIKNKNLFRSMDSREWTHILFPLRYRIDECQDMVFFFCGRMNIVREITSFLVYSKSIESDEKHLFLINSKEGVITSSLELSSSGYQSESWYWHSYSTYQDQCFNIYENAVIDFACGPEEPGESSVRTPLIIRLRCYINKLLTRKKYELVAKLRLDLDGFIYEK